VSPPAAPGGGPRRGRIPPCSVRGSGGRVDGGGGGLLQQCAALWCSPVATCCSGGGGGHLLHSRPLPCPSLRLPFLDLPSLPVCVAVRDRVVEALDQLYLTGWVGSMQSAAQAARALVGLASRATLGATRRPTTAALLAPAEGHAHTLWAPRILPASALCRHASSTRAQLCPGPTHASPLSGVCVQAS
jgi:hypothetical protein